MLEVGDHHLTGEIVPENEIENYKKIKGILHWVGKDDSVEIETRIYNRLFSHPFPGRDKPSIMDDINPNSKVVHMNSRIPKGVADLLKTHPRW